MSLQAETSGRVDNCILLSVFCPIPNLHANSKSVIIFLPSNFYLFAFYEHKVSWDVHFTSLEAFKVSMYDFVSFAYKIIVGGDESIEVMG